MLFGGSLLIIIIKRPPKFDTCLILCHNLLLFNYISMSSALDCNNSGETCDAIAKREAC